MAKRAIVRRGDRTTHGGTVLGGDPTFLLFGREVARVNDPVSCPQCKRNTRIATGAPTMFDSQLVARHDDVTDCGAKLIASQVTDTYEDGSEGSADATLAAMPAATIAASVEGADEAAMGHGGGDSDDEVPRGLRFRAVDPISGEALPKRPYVITREDGAQHGGLTDAQGYTEVVETLALERVAVHFMFAAPTGHTIDREDLVP